MERNSSQDGSTNWATLNSQLEQVARSCAPTADDRQARLDLIARVQIAVSQSSAMRAVRIIPYGSFISGFYNSTSDLDLAVSGLLSWDHLDKRSQRDWVEAGNPATPFVELCKLDRHTKQSVLRKAINKVMENHITDRSTVQYILHARVPIIKFKDIRTGVECDLSVGGDGQELKAYTFYLLSQVNPCFQLLFILVKLWAKLHGINDGTSGLFNSHCLALLVVFYLQQCTPPALPPMYRLFYSKHPGLDSERILMGDDTARKAEQARQTADSRVPFAKQEYQDRCQPLADMMLGFVTHLKGVLEKALTKPKESMRLSCWWGEMLTTPDASEYVLVVEEPMHREDNPARTFGKKNQFCWNLHYVADLLARTEQVLLAVQRDQVPPLSGLLFLLGPSATIQGPPSKKLSTIVGEQWCEWLIHALATHRGNTGNVLYEVLEHLKVPAEEWLPTQCRAGPIGYKQHAMASGKTKAKQRHQQQQQQPKQDGNVPTDATASQEGLDEVVAARSAAGLVGYSAVLAVATELEYRRLLRDLAKRARDLERKQLEKEQQERMRQREREEAEKYREAQREAYQSAKVARSSSSNGGGEQRLSRQSSGNGSEMSEEAAVARRLASLALQSVVHQAGQTVVMTRGGSGGGGAVQAQGGNVASGRAPRVVGRGAGQGVPGPGGSVEIPGGGGRGTRGGGRGAAQGSVQGYVLTGSAPTGITGRMMMPPRAGSGSGSAVGGVGGGSGELVRGVSGASSGGMSAPMGMRKGGIGEGSGQWGDVDLDGVGSVGSSGFSEGFGRGGSREGSAGVGDVVQGGGEEGRHGDEEQGEGENERGRRPKKLYVRRTHPKPGQAAGQGGGGAHVSTEPRGTRAPLMMASAGQGL